MKLGYRAEPRGLLLAFAMTVVMALPDALIALWLKFLADGFTGSHDRAPHRDRRARARGVGHARRGSCASCSTRIQRRFRDKISVALEAHVATLQASVATIEHHERPEYLDRLSVLRDQVFALDHLFMSLFSTVGWIVRLVATLVLLVTVSPLLVFLPLFAIPIVITAHVAAGRRAPGARSRSRRTTGWPSTCSCSGTTAPRGQGAARRRASARSSQHERRDGVGPVVRADRARRASITALWHTLAWALFGGAYVGAIVYVAVGPRRQRRQRACSS